MTDLWCCWKLSWVNAFTSRLPHSLSLLSEKLLLFKEDIRSFIKVKQNLDTITAKVFKLEYHHYIQLAAVSKEYPPKQHYKTSRNPKSLGISQQLNNHCFYTAISTEQMFRCILLKVTKLSIYNQQEPILSAWPLSGLVLTIPLQTGDCVFWFRCCHTAA